MNTYPDPYGSRPGDIEVAVALMEPGYGGMLRVVEVRYIREVLQKKRPRPDGLERGRLRDWWGLTRQGVASEAAIRAVALNGDPDDVAHNRDLVKRAKGLTHGNGGPEGARHKASGELECVGGTKPPVAVAEVIVGQGHTPARQESRPSKPISRERLLRT